MISGRSILMTSFAVWRAGRADSRHLQAIQNARLQKLVAYARRHSPYFRQRYRHLPSGPISLADLPTLSKEEMMVHLDAWVTDPAIQKREVEDFIADPERLGTPFLNRYAIWQSSGTTGRPGIFVQDAGALATYIALLLVRGYLKWMSPAQFWPMIRRGWPAAFVNATGGHFASSVFGSFVCHLRPGKGETRPIFSANQPMPALVEALNRYQPAVVATYPSLLAALTAEQKAGRLAIRPRLMASGGECLRDTVRQDVTAVFGCPVHDAYAASEFMGIALDCRHQRLHLNLDWVVLEPVDEDFRPVPPGVPSHSVLLTNLANHVQPLIRYELGDSVLIDPAHCPCGSPLPVIQVEGRDDELLKFRDKTGKERRLLPLPLAGIVEVVPGVHRFQLIQVGPSTLNVRLEVTPGSDVVEVWSRVRTSLGRYLATHGLGNVDIELAAEPPARQAASRKYRQVWIDKSRSEGDAGVVGFKAKSKVAGLPCSRQ